MTDKIVLLMSGTEDESLCRNDSAFKVEKANINADREENENVYEEYSKGFEPFDIISSKMFTYESCIILPFLMRYIISADESLV